MAQTTKKTAILKSAKKSARRSAGSARAPGKRAGSGGAAAVLLGLPLDSWVDAARAAKGDETRSAKTASVFYFKTRDAKAVETALRGALLPWQLDHALRSEAETQSYSGRNGPVFVLRPPSAAAPPPVASHGGALEKTPGVRARDQVGALYPALGAWKVDALALSFFGTTLEEERAALLGLEMAAYSFVENRGNPGKPRKKRPRLLLRQAQLAPPDLRWAAETGRAVNVARHLTNLPGCDLNPATYAAAVRGLFAGLAGARVDVWDGGRLESEGMNLLRAVGAGAAHGPRLVHIRYRPAGSGRRRPLALVGKGVTFDSGGLDLKSSSGMRWMKKDMGGSAAVVGAMYWAALRGLDRPLDAYLALAENAVDAASFRPGDVITARSGLAVEIHNTDAEGRLALADALDVAVKSADEPLAVIDLATLTGAIKVALGAEIAGLFANHDGLSRRLEEAGGESGELVWRMPLFQPYKNLFKSTFADCANASDGFAGAITAALFLQAFVGETPWAHIDIYAWRDSAGGAYAESGGSGQGVQLLARLLERWTGEGI